MGQKKKMLASVLLLTTFSLASSSQFNCTDFSVPPLATNITKLHPGHVRYVMAMGDSITAAFAARANLMEARDISWSAGAGKSDQLTFPYLLSQYSSSVKGTSTKAVLPRNVTHLPYGDYHPSSDHLNVAESQGAVKRGSLVQQWGYIQQQISNEKEYPNFNDSWKVLTIWMTANDVCGAGHECQHAISAQQLEQWVATTDETIANVSATMSKVYVNLVSTLNLGEIHRIQQSAPWCRILHKHILNECGCIDKGDPQQLAQLNANVHTMNAELHKLAAKWNARLHETTAAAQRWDMAVTVQGFMEGVGSQLDISFLNRLDCFHPSLRGHQDLAIGLWNNMLCTGKDRDTHCGRPFSVNMQAVCPTVDSVFYVGPDVVPKNTTASLHGSIRIQY